MNAYINDIEDDINALKKIILDNVPTEQIYVFGSYANGTPNQDSDIDIYIVMKDDAPMREWDAMDTVNYERIHKVQKPVDVLVARRSRFLHRQAGHTLENNVAKNGIKIYGF